MYHYIIILISSIINAQENDIYEKCISGHSPLTYKEVKIKLFNTIDNHDGLVCSIYTENQCKPYNRSRKNNNYHFNLNIEHSWPQSRGAKDFPATSDMHHLFVTSKESNSKRANHPFCEVDVIFWELGGSSFGLSAENIECFEPRDLYKGNIARALFYFSVRYKYNIDDTQEAYLRKWHQQDPVDQEEVRRSLLIQKLQGNINPFVMAPSLVKEVSNF